MFVGQCRPRGIYPSRLVVLALLALLASVLLVAATPLDLDLGEDEAVDLFVRATANHTGKYVGSTCTSSDECYSKNCVQGTCQRQPVGGPCFKGANCVTRNCNVQTGLCRTPSLLYGVCQDSQNSCATKAYAGQLTCNGQTCKLKDGATCTQDKACLSGTCGQDKKCGKAGLPPDADCNQDSDCQSGTCAFCYELHGLADCTNDDPYHTSSFCTRFALGHSCTATNQCDRGVCRGGTCSTSQVGDACTDQYTCTGDQVCGADKKCFVPAAGSLAPAQDCGVDDQCISKRCVTSTLGPHTVTTGVCDYLKAGQGPCRSTADCSTDVCKNGTCEPAQIGEECDVNSRCAGSSLCGLDGICYQAADQSVGPRGPCKTDGNCKSGRCVPNPAYSTTRLTLDDPREEFQVYERYCTPSEAGNYCDASSDCRAGLACDQSSKTCKGLAIGAACTDRMNCESQTCIDGQCASSTARVHCVVDGDCFSQQCNDASLGSCSFECPLRRCVALESGATCRVNGDCNDISGCVSGQCVTWDG
ncbi:hypothetical protein OC835_006605 [Tilletia horrida]|nr:hypothetical protein OC835_006605 [Tilletia horrida]